MNEVVFAQMVELIVIVATVQLCLLAFFLRGKFNELKKLALPVFFFFVFGTADALVTVANNISAVREGNPYARVFIELGGWKGYVFLSFLWICLWALFALVLLELRARVESEKEKLFLFFVCLLEFYALALGHLSGFLSWQGVFYPLGSQEEKFVLFILGGGLLGAIHLIISWRPKR